MDRLIPPEQLNLDSGNLAENWRQWRQRFEVFSLASGLSEKSEAVRSATLLHVAGPKALEVYNAFTWETEGDDKKVNKILEKFQTYCKPRKNITWERHVFNTRSQQVNETIDQYVTDLKIKASSCEFGEVCDSLVRDRIICGITCDKTRGMLLREGDITLQRTVEVCRANEAMKLQLKSMSHSTTADQNTETEIHSIKSKPVTSTAKPNCSRCGYKHTVNQTCPAYGAECRRCGRKNHFANVCRSSYHKPPTSNLNTIEHHCLTDAEDMFIGMIQMSRGSKDWKATILLNKQKTTFKLDTGAQCNVISKDKYNQISTKPLRPSHARLMAFGGAKLNPCGKTTISCRHKDKQYAVEFEVVDQNVPNILGLKACTEMNLIQRVDAIDNQIPDPFSKYSDVFEGLGCITNVVYHIEVQQDSKPVVHPPRRIPVTLRPKVREELNHMEKLDVIEKIDEPTEWVNSMVTVIKPNGKLRICIDPRDLNKQVKRQHYPTRTVDEIITRMPNAKIFSVLDANSGYWQIRLDHDSAKLCTFNTPYGRYMFKRLPFGLSSSQDIFQKVMSEMFEDIPGVEVIVDDILIWGEDEEQHNVRLIKVLERARSRNLKLNKNKCHINKHEISYVGHILSKDGLKPDTKKTEAITAMPAPENREQLQRFLGMLTYLAKFIPNLSQVASPLRTLLEKDVEWHWQCEQESSFKKLKQLATEAPVLKYFDPTKPTELSVDASSKGLGAVLIQEGHPITYASKALTQTQQHYAQIEKEMLAILFGCIRFHEYIYGVPNIRVETDHKPLEAILKKPLHQAPTRLQRMIIAIQKYSITVEYRPGKELAIADTLSRSFLPRTYEDPIYEEIDINFLSSMPISENKIEQLKNETHLDQEMQQLLHTVKAG